MLGTPKKATGSPYVFGVINDEAGPVTFPEARQAELAAAQYINNYMGAMARQKRGQSVPVTVLRNEKKVTLQVTPQ